MPKCRKCGHEYRGWTCPCRKKARNAARRRLGGGTRGLRTPAQIIAGDALAVNLQAVPGQRCRRCAGSIEAGRCVVCFESISRTAYNTLL